MAFRTDVSHYDIIESLLKAKLLLFFFLHVPVLILTFKPIKYDYIQLNHYGAKYTIKLVVSLAK